MLCCAVAVLTVLAPYGFFYSAACLSCSRASLAARPYWSSANRLPLLPTVVQAASPLS